jgi:hypothetical protein
MEALVLSHHFPCTHVLNKPRREKFPTGRGRAHHRPMSQGVLLAHQFPTFGTVIDLLDLCSAFFAFLVSLFVPPSLPVQIFLFVSDTVLLDKLLRLHLN